MNTKKIVISLLSALVFLVQSAFAAGAPENVTGLSATAIDASSIGLTWNAAKDGNGGLVNHYRIYYGTTSVFEAREGDYESQLDTKDNNTSYVLSGLPADTAHYFSVTAFDGDGVESEEYSLEVSATTAKDEGGDSTSPTVSSVSAPNKTHVKVVFSEAVKLPETTPETAFSIVEQINPANTLEVSAAEMDATDSTNKTVLVTTGEQTANVNYIITAGVGVKDTANNPIVSGSTDSGLFLGSAVDAAAAPAEGTDEPVVDPPVEEPAAAEAIACESDLEGCFYAQLADCSLAAAKDMDSKYEYSLEVTGADGTDCLVKYTADKHPNILFAGTDMECKVPQGTYSTTADYRAAFNVDNCTGDLQAGYTATSEEDVTPPENVTNLLLSFKEELEKYIVMLNWTASVNTAKDLVDQILYMSTDRGSTYDAGKALGETATSSEVGNLDGGKEYTFKVTTKDASGNESTGAVKSIRLPQTGMGIGLVLMGSAFAAQRALRRKEDDEL